MNRQIENTAVAGLSAKRLWYDQQTATLVFLAIAWLQLFYALTPFWQQGTYYDYGWFVPPAAAWFFWCRWQASSSWPRREGRTPILDFATGFLVILFLVSLLPLRIVENNETLWRLPRFLHFGLIATITHLLIARSYSARRSLNFLPVTIFTATALPLPLQLETAFVQNSTTVLMQISEPICLIQGFPVELAGSALVMDGEILEVNEGCTGIRSFQSMLMLGLFLGEFFLLHPFLRIVTVLFGIVVAFLVNIGRVVQLTQIYFNEGRDAFNQQHDMVGYVAFAISAAILIAASFLLAQLERALANHKRKTTPEEIR